MGNIYRGQKYFTAWQFKEQHSQLKKDAINRFITERKLGGKKLSDEKLEEVRLIT
jgi:hypothetical protein